MKVQLPKLGPHTVCLPFPNKINGIGTVNQKGPIFVALPHKFILAWDDGPRNIEDSLDRVFSK